MIVYLMTVSSLRGPVSCEIYMKFSIINEEGQILLLEREDVGEKMWKALQEVDGQLFAKYWCLATNILRDDLQQQNAFDCAVFFCFLFCFKVFVLTIIALNLYIF